ncbi:SulP family inorganic anion transporter [Marinilongibacter aquaticus]|uniref:SulP family inorganic anion transporter n=1 Tax=Marinilongibacter aquaticus TaxID=2975157 RepID=UPI0021BCFDE9|nr:SulP family inorganic anion transporter [Marinilongibacter aquaticus]UBM59850.1 SulP family inorganic anion transporter [Marinilongibacter aquaticus]
MKDFLAKDLSAGLVVFLVALPLCLGISLASDAPLFSGLIAGIVGGIVVGSLSGSRLGVSGPAAGLAVIVANAIHNFEIYEVFLAAVVFGGAIQLLLGILGAGKIAFFFPSSVIKGMLAAIGITIILKQIPHVFGIDRDPEGEMEFFQPDGENTISELVNVIDFNTGALLIGLISLGILVLWSQGFVRRNKILSLIPGPLLAVLFGIFANMFYPSNMVLQAEHLVQLPKVASFNEFKTLFTFPDFAAFTRFDVIQTGFIIAIIASLETLLCVEATDRLDPKKGMTPTNRELMAQGAGNMVAGLIGGIPVTQVIVRSSANIQAGGQTKISSIFHGFLLLGTVVFIPGLLNQIPLASLAAILIVVGYKLANPALFKGMLNDGKDQFIPFIATILAVLFTDLLIGILVGLLVGIVFVLYSNFKSAIQSKREGNHTSIVFQKDVFFYNRAELMKILGSLQAGDRLTLDASHVDFMDHDIFLAIEDFVQEAEKKKIEIEAKGIRKIKLKFGKADEIVELN